MQLSLPLDNEPILRRIRARLLAVHGPQRDAQRHDPTSQFVKAVISSRTLDAVSDAAFLRLASSLPSWERLADLGPEAVSAIIKSVTFDMDKSARLVTAAQMIRAYHGRFDLAFLVGWPVEAAMSWLQHLPGAGPKVAAATLNFSTLRKRVFVADTHVLRTSWRLGLVPNARDGERGFRILMRYLPDDFDAEDCCELHWLMKLHGQTVCRHRFTACGICPLAELCAYRMRSAVG